MNQMNEQIWGDSSILEELSFRIEKPHLYTVMLMNDDFTPMDFVVGILINFFNMTKERAIKTMLQVHYGGRGICGIYTYDIAETLVAKVNNYARSCEFPLLCSMEIA